MKTTYLVNDRQPDGNVALIETTAERWREIVKANKLLPKEERRYFVVDIINEPGVFDSMIIEVPYEEYLTWDVERNRMIRNKILKKRFQHFSVDAGFTDTTPTPCDCEGSILGEMMICRLLDALAQWHPWGLDFFWLYLNGQKGSSTSVVAEKYGVSLRQARRYKEQFEKFVKNFFDF